MSRFKQISDAKESIARILAIDAEIARLQGEQYSLLDPITATAIEAGPEVVQELITLLPSGFHRSELRVWLAEFDEKGQGRHG